MFSGHMILILGIELQVSYTRDKHSTVELCTLPIGTSCKPDIEAVPKNIKLFLDACLSFSLRCHKYKLRKLGGTLVLSFVSRTQEAWEVQTRCCLWKEGRWGRKIFFLEI